MTDPLADTQAAALQSERTALGARYELLALLGAGGMGNVYKARDLELDETIALKVLRPDIAGAPGAIERFRREVKLARRVTHPNVARVFDIGEHDGEKVLSMELVDGEPLSALMAREGQLALGRAIEIAAAICAGVGAAHAAGVVHRDLKPDNVLLAKDGRVVVTDFGIARAAQASEAAKTFGGFVGTPAYMAPEQVEGGEIDERADVFAFGAMLYEMLTGQIPWQGESAIAVAAARLMQPAPDPRKLRPDLPARVAELLLGCLARKPHDRPQKMASIASTLSAITDSRATKSVPPPRIEAPHDAARAGTRVAVLPFRNLGEPQHEYLADGLTDDLIDLLSVARGLRVQSRGVVAQYKGVDRDARQLGRELDVQVVVEGSVRKSATTLRIQARLISVRDGLQLWAKRFDATDGDVLALNDAVAHAVAEALTADLDHGPDRPSDPVAADLYLRARIAYHREYLADLTEAPRLFAQALARAPEDPRILAGYVMAQSRSMVDSATRQTLRTQAEHAVKLAPSLPEAHIALGAVRFHSFDEVGAVAPLRRALRITPGNAEVHDLLGRILDEADVPSSMAHLELASALEPNAVLPRMYIMRHYALAGDWDRAEDVAQLAKSFSPSVVALVRARLVAWHRDKKGAEELLVTVPPDVLSRAGVLLRAVVDGKAPADQSRNFLPANPSPRMQCFHAQLRAEIAASGGDEAAVLNALEDGDRAHLFDLAWMDRVPLLDFVRDNPRFQAVRASVAARAEAIRRAYFEASS